MNTLNTKTDNRPANGGGVWAGSSAETYIVFASDNETSLTTQLLEAHDIGYQPLKGSYVMQKTGEQVIEDSFIINSRDIQAIEDLGLIDNQESLLFLGAGDFHKRGARPAALIMNDESAVELGYLTAVSEEIALAQDNWSLHINSNQYFITTKEGVYND